tara:strand:- start:816 stop:2039 length:1224 start_codon:yes stop_codon:yes gene_type:complete
MAITFITQPTSNTPHLVMGKDKIIVQFSSNNTDIVSCIVEVLVDSVRVSATNIQPDIGTTDEFTIVLDDVLANHLGFNLNTTLLTGINVDSIGCKAFNVKIYEVTENPSTLLLSTAYDPDNASNTNFDKEMTYNRVFFNSTIDTISKSDFNVNDYKLNANTKKFLTDTPSAKNIELGQSEYLGVLYCTFTPSLSFKVEYLTYDASDALLNTDYINISEWDTPYSGLILNPYLDIPVGTSNLIGAGISLTNVAYYTVRIINTTGDVSELKRFDIVDACTHDVRIHWQNKYGKRDSYTFKGNKQESLDHEASTFMKAKGLTYSSDARGVSVMQNTLNNTFTAYSKSIGRDEYHWLSDMLINKRAWVEIDGNYFPIIIEDGTFFKTDERDMPIQFVLNYSLANPTKGLKG